MGGWGGWGHVFQVPGTFEVSTLCTVGGGAGGATAACTCAGWVELEVCAGLKPGLCTKPGFVGIKPLGAGVDVAAGG